MKAKIASLIFLTLTLISNAQTPIDKQQKFQLNITEKLNKFAEQRKKASDKYLRRFNKSQEFFLQKLCKKDPRKADALYSSWAHSQQNLNKKLNGEYKNSFKKDKSVYSSYNDTLLNAAGYIGSPESAQAANAYKNELKHEDYIRDYMRSQKLTMKKVSIDIPSMSNSFKGIDKSSYYFSQQIFDYNELFNKTDKWEEAGMELLRKDADFSKYMGENSQLAGLPKIPSDWGKNINGLQTIDMVKAMEQSSWNDLTTEGRKIAVDKLTDGAYQIFKMKTEFPKLASAADLPDFKPNPLRTKRIIDRLHYGFDFQFDNRTSIIPKGVTAAINGEFDLFPKTNIGLGIGYHTPFKTVERESKTSLPASWTFRSYADYKIKSILFFTVNYERNYSLPLISQNFAQSALAGLKLKYNRKGKIAPSISLLYDFLFDQHIPQTQMLVYRIGWGL